MCHTDCLSDSDSVTVQKRKDNENSEEKGKMRPDVISQTMRSYLHNDQKKNVNAAPLNAIKL